MEDCLFQLHKMEYYRIVALHHQEVQKQQQKAWYERNLKNKDISVGDLVLLYDNLIKGKPIKSDTAWVGPYVVEDMKNNSTVQLRTL